MTSISRVRITICVNEDSEGQKLTLDGYIKNDEEYPGDLYRFSETKDFKERVIVIEKKEDLKGFIVVTTDRREVSIGDVCKIEYLDKSPKKTIIQRRRTMQPRLPNYSNEILKF